VEFVHVGALLLEYAIQSVPTKRGLLSRGGCAVAPGAALLTTAVCPRISTANVDMCVLLCATTSAIVYDPVEELQDAGDSTVDERPAVGGRVPSSGGNKLFMHP